MLSRAFPAEKSCVGKRRYETRDAAETGAAKLILSKWNHEPNAATLHAYSCEHCSNWHIGHRPSPTYDPLSSSSEVTADKS